MQAETQHFWEHSIPKQSSVSSKRINITLRRIHQ
jgi:alkylated DNA repair dioxygenase AlkB